MSQPSSTTLILAAHGSPGDRNVNLTISRMARRLSRHSRFRKVVAAFHHGAPGFVHAIEQVNTQRAVVVPLMTSPGYFAKVVLQKALDPGTQANRNVEVSVTEPVGTFPGAANLVATRIEWLLHRFGYDSMESDVLIVGHGTRKHPDSRNATITLANRIDQLRNSARPLKTAFIDDDPEIREVVNSLDTRNLVVVPFLIANGPHARTDIPQAIGIVPRDHARCYPQMHKLDRRRVVVDGAFGTLPGIEQLVIECASSSLDARIPDLDEARSAGKVTLVGAGPGDPDLITVKGQNALRTADAVVYDRLVSRQLVNMASAASVLIDVGKKPGYHRVRQPEINQLLVDLAQSGKRVVRLKGGDPFVFGRGYEELEVCRSNGIRCEVVPGISSALAAPLVAGIPVTTRGIARSFAVVTAESGESFADPDHDFPALAKIDTLIVLMGRRTLESTVRRLVEAGRCPETPVTCIERATLHGQKVISGNLTTIAAMADSEKLQSPMVAVIGETAGFGEISNYVDIQAEAATTPSN